MQQRWGLPKCSRASKVRLCSSSRWAYLPGCWGRAGCPGPPSPSAGTAPTRGDPAILHSSRLQLLSGLGQGLRLHAGMPPAKYQFWPLGPCRRGHLCSQCAPLCVVHTEDDEQHLTTTSVRVVNTEDDEQHGTVTSERRAPRWLFPRHKTLLFEKRKDRKLCA